MNCIFRPEDKISKQFEVVRTMDATHKDKFEQNIRDLLAYVMAATLINKLYELKFKCSNVRGSN